jgi:tripartite-type tricarboxylate transporter receptor subunit TctC
MGGNCLHKMILAAIVVVAVLVTTAARANSVAEFYKGRTVSVIIGYSAGTGYDIYARLLARFIGRHIPGNPTVIAQNMPGGGKPQGRDVRRRGRSEGWERDRYDRA